MRARRERYQAAEDGLIFPNQDGSLRRSGSSIAIIMRDVAKRASFEKAFPMGKVNHKLRATFIHRMASLYDANVAQQAAGHDNLATTMLYLPDAKRTKAKAENMFSGLGVGK
jgi:integrase